MSDTSPRTQAEPMAFTRAEFWRGAIIAWLSFVLLALLPWAVLLGPYAVIALCYLVPWSLAAVTVFFAPAFALGWSLRRQPRLPMHLASFAALGLAIGATTTGVLFVVDRHLGDTLGPTVLAVNLGASAVAVPVGWWSSARRALRADAGQLTPPRPHPDAAAEDADLDDPDSAR